MPDLHHDYNVNAEVLTTQTTLPRWYMTIGVSVLSVILNITIPYWLIVSNDYMNQAGALTFSISFGIAIYFMGLVGGSIWLKIGKAMARITYVPYIFEKYSIFSKIYIKFAEKDAAIYFEGQAKDPRVEGVFDIGKLVFRISLSQLGFYVTVMALVLNPLRTGPLKDLDIAPGIISVVQPILALSISIVILSLYLPMSFILRDSNLRTFDKEERVIGYPSGTIRSYIDGLAGISALASGWSIFGALRENQGSFFITGTSTFMEVLDYISWLIFIMMISWPIILPAVIYFFRNYDKTVNDFRTQAIKEGIPVAVTKVRELGGIERQNLDLLVKRSDKTT